MTIPAPNPSIALNMTKGIISVDRAHAMDAAMNRIEPTRYGFFLPYLSRIPAHNAMEAHSPATNAGNVQAYMLLGNEFRSSIRSNEMI